MALRRLARHRAQRPPRHHRVRRRRGPQAVGAEGDARAWPTTWRTKGAQVEYLRLPDTDDKTGLDDYLMAGHTVDGSVASGQTASSHRYHQRRGSRQPAAASRNPQPVQPVSLDDAHKVFRRWLGEDYDTDALDADARRRRGREVRRRRDPVWLLIISGSGNAKTETVQALDGVGAIVTSTITGEGALLSATPRRERAKDATGGLLRKIGDRGVLVIKDVTSILSMNRDIRAKVLAALREIYDGRWYRNVGTDGGRTLDWKGRIVVIGAVTTAWDTAHAVIATMGDRFVLVRIDSTKAGMAVRAAGHRATPATRRRCAPSWPPRWPASSPG